jgi:hypothetical protein
MKKEFSFYEFVGILVPATILLFSWHLIYEHVYQKQIIDFSNLGETLVFITICYGVGHLLHSLGNLMEKGIWFIFRGFPTKWLSEKNIFGKNLFNNSLNKKIIKKVKQKFGKEVGNHGNLVYNFIFLKSKTERVDIFNANYCLFRGLSISFILIMSICVYYHYWETTLLLSVPLILSLIRMFRFGKYYAKEIYITFYNLSELE